jgi:hypothetical protein
MPACPNIVGNAKVICYTTIDERHRHTGNTKQIWNGVLLGPASGLAICQYPNESSFFLFGCDDKWNVRSDTWHETLDDAIRQAEFEYEGSQQTWQYF